MLGQNGSVTTDLTPKKIEVVGLDTLYTWNIEQSRFMFENHRLLNNRTKQLRSLEWQLDTTLNQVKDLKAIVDKQYEIQDAKSIEIKILSDKNEMCEVSRVEYKDNYMKSKKANGTLKKVVVVLGVIVLIETLLIVK